MTELKEGDIVNVYEDPLSQTKFEGKAKLIKKILPSNQMNTERWKVNFLDDKGCIDSHFKRWIKSK